MMRVIWREVSRTESEFYAMNRRVFGEDVYVTKHPTWHTGFRGSEFMHNGLDWWTARRDFAQSDETVPLPCILGMARKTNDRTAAVPEALQAVTPDWIRLWSPRP